MDDSQLTIAAATLEVGVAIVVLIGVLKVKPMRQKAVVVLGAITPAIVAMIALAYWQFVDPTPGSMAGAGWVMGFAAYVVLLLGGVATSFLSRPTNPYFRYLLGLATAPVSLGLLTLI